MEQTPCAFCGEPTKRLSNYPDDRHICAACYDEFDSEELTRVNDSLGNFAYLLRCQEGKGFRANE